MSISFPHLVITAHSGAEAIEKALSREFREVARKGENPYFSPDTLDKSVIAIQNFAARLPVGPKQFHDIDFETD